MKEERYTNPILEEMRGQFEATGSELTLLERRATELKQKAA